MCSFRLCPPNQKVFPTPLYLILFNFIQLYHMLAHSTMAQPDSTRLHLTLPDSTRLHLTPPDSTRLYLTLPDFTQIYPKLQWLYLKLETGEVLRMRLVRAEMPSELETPTRVPYPKRMVMPKPQKKLVACHECHGT